MGEDCEADSLKNAWIFGLRSGKTIQIPSCQAIGGRGVRVADTEDLIIVQVLLPPIYQAGSIEDREEFRDSIIGGGWWWC